MCWFEYIEVYLDGRCTRSSRFLTLRKAIWTLGGKCEVKNQLRRQATLFGELPLGSSSSLLASIALGKDNDIVCVRRGWCSRAAGERRRDGERKYHRAFG
jgi:hypothetical protein